MMMHAVTMPAVPHWLMADSDLRSGPAAGQRSSNAGDPRSGKMVLVVDDEDTIADSVAEILQDSGYVACAVYSGRAAIEAARARCPDILMCDVLMPQLNGVDTAIAIKQLCARTRILLFSGQAATKDILKRARADGHQFELLPKPIHPVELLRKLSG